MSLYPEEKKKMDPKDYEKVPVGKFVEAVIEEVQFKKDHQFKGEHARIGPAIRLKFNIDGLKFPHYSRWYSFTYAEKSHLYKEILLPLVEGAKPSMNFDIERLNGFRVKMVWINNGEYQTFQLILPSDDVKITNEEQVPF